MEEHLQVRHACGVILRRDFVSLDIGGEDREKFLHGLLSNEVSGLKIGKGNLAHLLTPKGKVQAQTEVFKLDDRLRLICERSQMEPLEKNIRMRILRSQVKILEAARDMVCLCLYGPKSRAVMEKILPRVDLGEEYDHGKTTFSGHEVWCVREHWTGEMGFHLWLEEGRARELLQRFVKEPEVKEIGEGALTSLLMEAGVPQFGADFDGESLSLEVNLQKAVSNTKGCYLGQETVNRMLSRGHVAKRLVGLIAEGRDPFPAPSQVVESRENPREIGRVTRSLFSPTLERGIAFAFLKYDYMERCPNHQVSLLDPQGQPLGEARWVELPFYRQSGINWLSGGPTFQKVIAPHRATSAS